MNKIDLRVGLEDLFIQARKKVATPVPDVVRMDITRALTSHDIQSSQLTDASKKILQAIYAKNEGIQAMLFVSQQGPLRLAQIASQDNGLELRGNFPQARPRVFVKPTGPKISPWFEDYYTYRKDSLHMQDAEALLGLIAVAMRSRFSTWTKI